MDHIAYALKKGAEYVELNSVEVERSSISVSNRKIMDMSSGTNQAHSVRVLFGGRWGNAFSVKEEYDKLIDSAISNAKATGKVSKIGSLAPLKKEYSTKVKVHPQEIGLEVKKEDILKLESSLPKEISNLTLNYSDVLKDMHYMNSEGSDMSWKDVMTHMSANAYAKRDDRIESFYDVVAMHAGYETSEAFDSKVKEVVSKCIELLDAKQIKGGFFPAVVDPKLGGVFAHECIGHPCEADLVLTDTSLLKGRIGTRIAPEHVSIYDDGSLQDKWGWCPFDSEGVKGRKTTLIDKGILNSYLHTRETAEEFGVDPTGNGRAQSLSNKVIPRMTNTYIGRGDVPKDEIIESVKDGYYLIGSAGGQTDPASGEFLFNAMEAFKIEGGEIKHRVKGASLTGNLLETLGQISMVGKDLMIEGTGMCGKAGQYVNVGDGSPHIRLDNVKVGGQN